jgi:phenylalanyl-tRNA synthetase beta chain
VPHWSAQTRAVDFFDIKGIVEALASAAGLTVEYTASDCPFLTPGRAAEARLVDGNVLVGVFGQLLPSIVEARGFPANEEIFAGELDLVTLAGAVGADFRAAPLPRFPSIVRDLSLLVDEALPAAAVRGTIRSEAPATLASIAEFDRYQGKGVPEGQISLSLRLTFRAPDRTLTDDEVQAATERIVEALGAAHGAVRR